jgi:aminocarboxymuconate-semialdehyde decarboxylase
LSELSRGEGYARVSRDDLGRLLIHYEGDYNIVVPSHVDVLERISRMNNGGIDLQVLTLTTPSVERESQERGIKLSRLANEGFHEIIEKYPDRFAALAALPLQSPEDAVEELERSVKDLGLSGGTLMSNVGGKTLDSDEFLPLFRKAVELDVPMYIHPTSPINSKGMEDFRLVPIMGFGVDTSLAVLRLVFSGIFDRLPELKLVASHLGGVYPYLRGRIDRGYKEYPECKVNIESPPSSYLKRIWVDSIIYDSEVLKSTLSFVGADKIMLGTDEPHQIGDIENAVKRIRHLGLSKEDTEKILGANALQLLKI